MHRHALINIVVRDLDLARKLHVVVREFTNLDVINTKSLLFFSCTQTECRQKFADKVQCAQNQTSADERVCAAGERVGKLVAQLDPVVVEPTAINDSVAIKVSYVVAGIC
jgi:hypothetical protein